MLRTLALVAGTCLLLPAQEARQRTAGIALDAAAQPWTGARVVFVSCSIPWEERAGHVDRVEATVDDRGRFRADLLLLRSYSVWAEQPPDRASAVAEAVMAGQTLRLSEAARRAKVTLRLAGTEPWAAHGQLAVRAVTTTDNAIGVGLALDDRRQAALPLLPGEDVAIEVRLGPASQVIHRKKVSLVQAAEHELALPPPALGLARVIDADSEHSVAGALLRPVAPGLEASIGTTAADGTCRFVWPILADRVFLGPLAAFGREHGEQVVQLGITEPPDRITATFRMKPQTMLRGRLLDGGRPAGRHPLLLEALPNAGRSDPPRVFLTETDGSFALPVPEADHTARLATVLAPADQVRHAGRASTPCWPEAFLMLHPARSGELGLDLGDIDLARLHRCELRLCQPDGAPIPHGEVALLPPRGSQPSYLRLLRTTRQGSVTVLVAPGTWTFGHVGPHGYGLLEVEVGAATPGQRPATLMLERATTVAGRVVNDRGQPLPGAQVAWSFDVLDRTSELCRLWLLLPRLRTTADDDGTFRVWVPPGIDRLQLVPQVTRGVVRYAADTFTTVVVGETPEPVTVTIPNAPAKE